MRFALMLLILGLASIVAGVALIYPPAAFIVGGAGLAVAAFVLDWDQIRSN